MAPDYDGDSGGAFSNRDLYNLCQVKVWDNHQPDTAGTGIGTRFVDRGGPEVVLLERYHYEIDPLRGLVHFCGFSESHYHQGVKI